MDALDGDIRILHVDDDPDFAEVAAAFLKQEDDRFAVETATSASEGQQRLAETAFDCVVSDYEMPGRDGIEFLEAVREEYPDLPFILYTGKGSEAVASDAISAGVTDYLQKGRGTSQYAVLANRIRNSVEKYHVESELRDREQRLNLFFEQSPLGVVEWDASFNVVRLNDAAEEILGYAEEELVGRSWEAIVPESDRGSVDDVVGNLLENEGGYHSVNENVRGDGERIRCEWHNRVVTDAGGDVVGIFSQFQDVTERREQEQRLETLIDNLPGMVYRCRNDPAWPMECVWGEVEALTGYTAAEFEAGEVAWGDDVLHPDDRERLWETTQEALAADGEFEVTYRIVTADGATRWVWERGQRIAASGDDVAHLEGFITDITERERAQRELREEREFIDQTLDALDDIFYVLGPEGELRRWNCRLPEVTGYTDDEIADMETLALFPESERARISDAIEEALATGSSVVEAAVLTADGDRIPHEFTGARLTDDGGEATGLVGIGRDVTERGADE